MNAPRVHVVIDLSTCGVIVFPATPTETALLEGLSQTLRSEDLAGQILRLLLSAGELDCPDGLFRSADFPDQLWARLQAVEPVIR